MLWMYIVGSNGKYSLNRIKMTSSTILFMFIRARLRQMILIAVFLNSNSTTYPSLRELFMIWSMLMAIPKESFSLITDSSYPSMNYKCNFQ